MEYRKLGKSDLLISRIGFGTMSLELDNPLTPSVLHSAIDSGINFFDTADLYQKGLNESVLGKALRGKRDQVILATKVGNQWRPDGSVWDWNPSKKYILSAIDQSLSRLQTDYIDLYQLHGGTIDDPIDEIIEAFEILKAAGKIRYYGISSIRPNVIRAYVKKSSVISVMMQYSLLDRRPEEEMLPFLEDHEIGVLARGSIAKGLLVSKSATNYLNYSVMEVGKAAGAVRSASDANRHSLGTAMQFVLQHRSVSSAILGIRTEAQLKEALTVCDSPIINSKQMQMLTRVLPANRYEDHR